MKKIYILIMLLLLSTPSLMAQDSQGDDQDFMANLANIKSPFDDGIPKPPPVIQKPVVEVQKPVDVAPPAPAPVAVVPELVMLPTLNVQGVIVGDGIQEAIINDTIVPLRGSIDGVELTYVTKTGIMVFYKGKKFFLKVD